MKMTNSNKITNTKVGDDIHFYVNGSEDRGIVVKMNNEYVTVFKESTQEYDDIHINDTFFIKDILVNKEWDKMNDDERYDALKKIHAPSPRFIMKSWNELPKEIKELLTKNNAIETSHKEGKDDDMNNTTRVFDDSKKGFGQGELGEEGDKPKEDAGTAGEKIENEKPKGGETESRDAGRKTQGKKTQHEHIGDEGADKFGHGKRSHSGQETAGHTRATDSIKLLSQQVSKDPEIAASDKKQEADLFSNQNKPDKIETRQAKERGREAQGTKETDKKVTAGMKKLKAWQLWLAKREQQLLKDAQSGDVRIHDSTRLNARPADSPQSHSEASTAAKDPASRGGNYNTNISSEEGRRGLYTNPSRPDYSTEKPQNTGAPAGEKIDDKVITSLESDSPPARRGRTAEFETKIPKGDKAPKDIKRAWESWLDNKKTNSERSIHGNAAREPNSGVNTNIGFDAPKDYEGFTHSGVRPEQFKHEKLKPKVKERINIGTTNPSKPSQGTGDGGNPHNTRQQNKDVKGRAVSGKDRK
jgi:hypothetical protein